MPQMQETQQTPSIINFKNLFLVHIKTAERQKERENFEKQRIKSRHPSKD